MTLINTHQIEPKRSLLKAHEVQIVVNDPQVLALWKEFNKSKVVKISAFKVGMDRKTAAIHINSKVLLLNETTSFNGGDVFWFFFNSLTDC